MKHRFTVRVVLNLELEADFAPDTELGDDCVDEAVNAAVERAVRAGVSAEAITDVEITNDPEPVN